MKPNSPIESLLLTVRRERVILAADLATIYDGVETRTLTQAVKRNDKRFPADFVFQLTADEFGALKSEGRVTSDGHAALRSHIVILKQQAGLSQKDLAELLKTSQQQISRLESPGYEGHSLSMLRRVAGALNARVRIVFEPATR